MSRDMKIPPVRIVERRGGCGGAIVLAATTTAATLGAVLGWYVRGPRPWWDTTHGCQTTGAVSVSIRTPAGVSAEEITARMLALREAL